MKGQKHEVITETVNVEQPMHQRFHITKIL